MSSLFELFKNTADKHSLKTAIVDNERHYSYQELLQEINKAAFNLQSIADRSNLTDNKLQVALVSENAKDLFCITMAIAKLGGICVPVNPSLTLRQLQENWQACEINIVLFDSGYRRKLSSTQHSIQLVCIDDLDDYADTDYSDEVDFSNPDDDFLITLSSGSTGKPKPIIFSQQAKIKRARQTWKLYNLTTQDSVLCASPFYHSLGQRLFFVPLLLGSTLVYLNRFTPKLWHEAISTNQITYTISVSSHLYALQDLLFDNSDDLKSLRTIVTSSAPIDATFKSRLFKSIGCEFFEIYGASEVATTTNLTPKQSEKHYKTVGKACDNVSIKILDENLIEVPENIIGEITVKTDLAFNGYYNLPDVSKRSIHNGFFLTGDLGKVDQNGYLTYVSRKKDIIISGGINIYPKEIENTILQHLDISEVAVVGVEDNLLGEVIIAICVANDTSKKIEQELYRICNKELAPYQRPLKYFFHEALPLTSSGKVSKQVLRDTYNDKDEDWSSAIKSILFSD